MEWRSLITEIQLVQMVIICPPLFFGRWSITQNTIYYQNYRGRMKGGNLRSLSFYQAELACTYDKYRKVAELQTRLALNDLTNHQLSDQINQLRQENMHLRQQIHVKETGNTIHIKNHKKTALDRVNTILQDLHNTNVKRKYQPLSSTASREEMPGRVAAFFGRRMGGGREQEEARVVLDKSVYMEAGKEEKRVDGVRREEQREELKFPGHLNESLGKRTQSRFQLQEEQEEHRREQVGDKPQRNQRVDTQQKVQHEQQQVKDRMNRWSSQQAFGIGSDFLQKAKSGSLQRRKTFLSVVSVSSKSMVRRV